MTPINPSTDDTPAESSATLTGDPAAARESTPIRLRPLPMGAPVRWLARGLADFRRHPSIGLFYGLCFVAMGWGLLKVYENAPAYMLALSAGFLLMGPFLCMGLYDVSMKLERGERPDFGDSLVAWESHLGQMAIFGFVLLVLEMLWGRAAMVVFAVSFDGMPDMKGSLLALLDPDNIGFIVTYLGVGAIFAGLIFAVSVISIPMMLDRQVDAITAGLTSMRLVLTQPGVMIFWGALLTALTLLAMLPGFLGLIVLGPILGHASWHAYRDAVIDETRDPDGNARG